MSHYLFSKLLELSEREQLSDLLYAPQQFRWFVDLDPDGTFLVHSALDERGKATKEIVPRPENRSRTISPNFLYDTLEYIFGVQKTVNNKTTKKDRVQGMRQAFLERVAGVLSATKDEGVAALDNFLFRVNSGEITFPQECVGDEGAFCYFKFNGEMLTERPEVKNYWKKINTSTEGNRTCIITGEKFEKGNFPKIKGFKERIALLSFNKKLAYNSWNREDHENVPIHPNVQIAITDALNVLLDPQPEVTWSRPDLKKRHVRVNDTKICFWSDSSEGNTLANCLAMSNEHDPDRMSDENDTDNMLNLYNAVKTGKWSDRDCDSKFFVLAIIGKAGRARIGAFDELTLNEAKENIKNYFDELGEINKYPPINNLLRSLVVRGDLDRIPKPWASTLLDCMINYKPYPLALIKAAIEREANYSETTSDGLERLRHRYRLMFLRAALIRHFHFLDNERSLKMLYDSDSQAYLHGCRFAILCALQELAQGKVGTPLDAKYIKGMLYSPKRTMTIFEKRGMYVSTARKRGEARSASRLDKVYNFLSSKIDLLKDSFSVDQQQEFLLGFDHMRWWISMKKEARIEWEEKNDTAPVEFLWYNKKTEIE